MSVLTGFGEIKRTIFFPNAVADNGSLILSQLIVTIAGFFIASIVPVIAIELAIIIKKGSMHVTMLPEILLLYPFSAAATVGFGVPAFLLFRHYGLIRWWSTIAIGSIIGAVVAAMLEFPRAAIASEILFYSLTGAASAFAFWLIWRLGRDKQIST